jgi:tyrosyl-tRNA synthetase
MDAKKRLARTITAQYHGDAAAAEAEAHFARVHQHRDVPDEIETARVPADGTAISGRVLPPPGAPWPLGLVLKEAGLVSSTSEARRMIQQGAVEIDRRRVTSIEETLAPGREYLIQVGKRRFKRVVLGADG